MRVACCKGLLTLGVMSLGEPQYVWTQSAVPLLEGYVTGAAPPPRARASALIPQLQPRDPGRSSEPRNDE